MFKGLIKNKIKSALKELIEEIIDLAKDAEPYVQKDPNTGKTVYGVKVKREF